MPAMVVQSFAAAAAVTLVAMPLVSGHGSMTIPKPRNTVDGDLFP